MPFLCLLVACAFVVLQRVHVSRNIVRNVLSLLFGLTCPPLQLFSTKRVNAEQVWALREGAARCELLPGVGPA